jgi:ankyrin repeat protein
MSQCNPRAARPKHPAVAQRRKDQVASSKGHEQVVKLLLDKGADVNAQGGGYSNARQVASHAGHKQVVNLQLDKGVSVNAQGGYYGIALQAASSKDNEQVVKLLLDKGASVNARSMEDMANQAEGLYLTTPKHAH